MNIGDEENAHIHLKVFGSDSSGDPPFTFCAAVIPVGCWQTVELPIPSVAAQHCAQICPVDRPAVIEVSEISILSDDGGVLWAATTLPDLQTLQTAGSISLLPGKGRCLFFSFKNDPLWLLPPIDTPGNSLRLKIVLCVHKDFGAVLGALEAAYAEFYEMAAQVRTAAADRNQVVREYKRKAEAIAEDLDAALRKMEEQTKAAEAASQRVAQLETQNNTLVEQNNTVIEQNNTVSSELDALRAEHRLVLQTLSEMEGSLSWRITAPLRSALAFVRRL